MRLDLGCGAKKVALFTTSLAAGGAEKSLLRIAECLTDQGKQVLLIVASLDGVIQKPERLEIKHLSKRAIVRFSLLRKLWLATRLKWVLLSNNCDLVISTLPTADEIVALSRFPKTIFRIANLYGLDVDAQRSELKRRRRLRRYRKLYENRPIVCTTEYMAEHMRTYFGARKISVIHNFNDQPWCSDISQPVFQQSYCIHIGRFVPQKRHQFLLEVWASRGSLPDLVLLTQHSPELDIEIQRLGLEDRVIVVGYVQDPMPLIGASQCLVLCSDYEGFPSVLLEAMHAKTRIASGSCGGVASEICSRVPEVICRNDSIQEFGADLEEILKRPVPDYSTTLSWYSRERANHLWSALIDQMV